MRVADYIAGLTVTQGAGAGEPFRVLPWQRRFLRGFTDTDGDVALSISRGAGKSTLIAGLACATIDGPLMQRRAESVIVASSFTQGRIVYEHVLAFLRERGHDLDDRKAWRLQDSQNSATVEYRATGARVRCIGSDPARAHGLAPALVIADEPTQWPGSTSERMRAALVTSMGKLTASRFVALGTRPADRSHWFQAMLDGRRQLRAVSRRPRGRSAVPVPDVVAGESFAHHHAGAAQTCAPGSGGRQARPVAAGRIQGTPPQSRTRRHPAVDLVGCRDMGTCRG